MAELTDRCRGKCGQVQKFDEQNPARGGDRSISSSAWRSVGMNADEVFAAYVKKNA